MEGLFNIEYLQPKQVSKHNHYIVSLNIIYDFNIKYYIINIYLNSYIKVLKERLLLPADDIDMG